MGDRGPVPFRSEELSRERDANRGDRPELKKGTLRPVQIPKPDETWHTTAKRLYIALSESGQADFFQNSDWAFAWSLCEDISVMKRLQMQTGKPHAEALKALYGAMGNLMFTEADRRRLRIELMDEADDTKNPSVTQMEQYRKGLKVAK